MTTTLSNLVDLAIGTPETGAVNLGVLNTLLHAVLAKLNIENVQADLTDEDGRNSAALSGYGTVSFRQLEERVNDLEDHWQHLNLIPTNSELFRRIRKMRLEKEGSGTNKTSSKASATVAEKTASVDKTRASVGSISGDLPMKLVKTGQPVYDMWQNMQIVKQLEKNTDGITKLFSLIEDLMRDFEILKTTAETLVDHAEKSSGMGNQLDEIYKWLKMLQDRISELEKEMEQMPDDEFFDSLPTWTKLELYFQGIHGALEGAGVSGSELTSVLLATTSRHRSSGEMKLIPRIFSSSPRRSSFQRRGRASVIPDHVQGGTFQPYILPSQVQPSQQEIEPPVEIKISPPPPRAVSPPSPPVSSPSPPPPPTPPAAPPRSATPTASEEPESRTSTPHSAVAEDSAAPEEETDVAPLPEAVPQREDLAALDGRKDKAGHRHAITPASSGLQDLFEKLGNINLRHEILVLRVDELEKWLTAELAKKVNADSSIMNDIALMLKGYQVLMDELACVKAMFDKEAGSLICAQEKMKQLQSDVDCILKACYPPQGGQEGITEGKKCNREPDCNLLQCFGSYVIEIWTTDNCQKAQLQPTRMSWCAMQERIATLQTMMTAVVTRMGGNEDGTFDEVVETFITMSDVQEELKHVYSEIDDKVSHSTMFVISTGLGDVLSELMAKLLDNDNEWRRVMGFVAAVLDAKVDRDEMSDVVGLLEQKLRCLARRVTSVQTTLEGDPLDPAAGTKKARCISCDRVVNVERHEGHVVSKQVLPPGMPISKSLRVYTSLELEQYRQLARSMPSPLRPNETCDPYAIYRRTGGVTCKKQTGKRTIPTSACVERELVDCQSECIDGQAGAQSVTCFVPMDPLCAIDAEPLKSSNISTSSLQQKQRQQKGPETSATNADCTGVEKVVIQTPTDVACTEQSQPWHKKVFGGAVHELIDSRSDTDRPSQMPTANAVDSDISPAAVKHSSKLQSESTELSPPSAALNPNSVLAKRRPPPKDATANSPCMVKSDLSPFIEAQKSAIASVLANNRGQDGDGPERKAYKWPTASVGNQVGGSLTKISSGLTDAEKGQRGCGGSTFKLKKKKSN